MHFDVVSKNLQATYMDIRYIFSLYIILDMLKVFHYFVPSDKIIYIFLAC